MNVQFERAHYLRTSDFDCRMKLAPAAVLDIFQDAAGCHAEELGIGYEPMLEKRLIWVVVKIKFQILSDPEMHSRVKIRTWPLPPTRIGFRREYFIEDDEGRLLVKGSSEWVLMNADERRLTPVKDVYPFSEGFLSQQAFEGRISKVRDFETDGEGYAVRPGFSDLDMNGHVNNTKYANFVMDALELAPGELIDTFQIDYHREVQKGSKLSIFTTRDGGEIRAKGVSEQGENMFSCRITLR